MLNKIMYLSFASIFVVHISYAQKIYGSGKVVTESRQISDFNILDLDGIFDVVIQQSDSIGVKIEADDNLLSHLKIESKENILKIYDEDEEKIKKYTKFKVYVNIKNINTLKTNMYGKVMAMNALQFDTLTINSVSENEMTLPLNGKYVNINMASSGNLNLSGSSSNVLISLSNTGNLNAFGLVTENSKINSSGAGGIELTTNNEIIVASSGTGFVHIKGNGKFVKKDVSGLGTVKKVK